MSTLRTVLLAALTAGLFFAPSAAEARFGKRSSSSSSDDKEEKQERKHAATPVGQKPDRDSSSNDDDDDDDSHDRPRHRPHRETYVYVAPPPPVHSYRPTTVEQVERTEQHSPLLVRMGLLGNAMGGGRAVGLHLLLEGRQFGLNTRLTSLELPTDDGTPGTDDIGLGDMHMTWAPWSTPQGRFRLEAGLAVAAAPDVTFVGPSLGVSFEKCLIGALDVEGKLHIVPVPHRQADLQGGLALHMGVLSLRGGWRVLVLDDAGLLDGVVHRDVMAGPYAGIGLNF